MVLALDSIIPNGYCLIKKLPFIFNLPLSKMIEFVSEKLVERGHVEEAIRLCNNLRVRFLLL